jgi:hypothetical protein
MLHAATYIGISRKISPPCFERAVVAALTGIYKASD